MCKYRHYISIQRAWGQSTNTYFKNNSSNIFSCIRTHANTGPTCIRAKINSSRIFFLHVSVLCRGVMFLWTTGRNQQKKTNFFKSNFSGLVFLPFAPPTFPLETPQIVFSNQTGNLKRATTTTSAFISGSSRCHISSTSSTVADRSSTTQAQTRCCIRCLFEL